MSKKNSSLVEHSEQNLLAIDLSDNKELAPALAEIVTDFPERFGNKKSGRPVCFSRLEGEAEQLQIVFESDRVIIRYSTPACAFRGLATVMSGQTEDCITKTFFPSRGVMVDMSRNGVLRSETLRYIIRRMALMGLNRLLLYSEDIFSVEGAPFVGYFRGGYTTSELREMDQYAALFGIEIVPCIQTLGHLEQILQWPAYQHLRDTSNVLLAGEKETYAFIEKLIDTATAPFRSRRIHVGIDEAHGVGSGVYRQKNGPHRPFDVLSMHLEKVAAICQQRNLDPMIWSDMFFRLGSVSNDYYDRESVIPEDAIRCIPGNVDLVYWDYYHRDEAFYDEWIARHNALGKTPVFAAGVWTWNRFWTGLPHSLATIAPGMAAARRGNIKEVFATLWCDDGAECDFLSALPGLEFFAAECFERGVEAVQKQFYSTCDADWDSWYAASLLDHEAGDEGGDGEAANLSKILLWHDPLLGFFEKHFPDTLSEQYTRLQVKLEAASKLSGNNTRLAHPARLAAFLSLKARLHQCLRPAYQKHDLSTLEDIVKHLLPDLQTALRKLHEGHRLLWRELYQPFGWDVIDRRYGGLRSRLETLSELLKQHIHVGDSIPELELEPRIITPPEKLRDMTITHARTASASAIS
ncbi:MAG: family 20 glycosylhydrolase [Chthoniobacterales bacterium]